jgi:hypothetical protein
MTDSIQASVQEKCLSLRWVDILETRQENDKTGDEIAVEVIRRCGLRIKGGE